MKKVLIAIFLLVLSFGMLTACKSEQIDVSGVKMTDVTVQFDGERHTIKPEGLPEGVIAIPQGTVQYREEGTYTITYKLVSAEDGETEFGTVSATLKITPAGEDGNEGGEGEGGEGQGGDGGNGGSQQGGNTDGYQVKVGSNSFALEGPDADGQYYATISVEAGQTLSFTNNGEAVSATADPYETNNIDASMVVRTTASNVNVYLKADGQVWLDGYQETGSFQVKVGDGNPVDLAANPDNASEKMATISVEAGQTLSFLKDGAALEVTADPWETNNVDASMVVRTTASDVVVYLKSGNVVWLNGYQAGGNGGENQDTFALVVGETEVALTKNEKGEWVALDVELHADDVIKAKNVTQDTEFGLGMNEYSQGFEAVDGGVKVLADGHYDLYLQLAQGADKLYGEPHKTGEDSGEGTGEFTLAAKYEVKIGDAAAVEMEKNEQYSGTAQAEFQLLGQALAAGQVLEFYADGTLIAKIGPAQSDNDSNNVEKKTIEEVEKLAVRSDATDAGIYLKAYSDGGYDVWVDGYQAPVVVEDTFALVVGETEVALTKNEKGEWVALDVELHADDLIKAKNLGQDEEFALGMNEHSQGFEAVEGGVKVLEDGHYDLYLQLSQGADKLYGAPHKELDTTKLFLNMEKWDDESATERYAAYFFKNESSEGAGDGYSQWADMTLVEGEEHVYVVDIDAQATHVIFCRMNGEAADNNWDNKWNQTQDWEISGNEGKSCYVDEMTGASHWY